MSQQAWGEEIRPMPETGHVQRAQDGSVGDDWEEVQEDGKDEEEDWSNGEQGALATSPSHALPTLTR